MVDFGVPGYVNSSRLPADELRRLQHNQTGGARGVVLPGDLKVSALNVPGAGVRIAPGDDLIPCRAPDRTRETYSVPLFAEGTYMGDGGEGLPGTGSSGVRRDMIIHEITDPALPRTYTPRSEIPDGVLSKITVVPGVSATAKTVEDVPELANVTCYELAMITYPANTATITNAMIKDLRQVATPFKDRLLMVRAFSGTEQDTLTGSTEQSWPAVGSDLWGPIDIPLRATRAKIVIGYYGVIFQGDAYGDLWVRIGTADVRIESTRFNSPGLSSPSRAVIEVAGEVAIPPAMRGTAQRFYPRGVKSSGSAAGSVVRMDNRSSLKLDVEFYETTV